MNTESSLDNLTLQFLVQEVLQDLGRYYERYNQRSIFQESLQGVQQDLEEYVIDPYATRPEDAEEELENVLEAVADQLARTNDRDTVKIKAYLDVFDEWCRERLNTNATEILEAGTEEETESQKWLETVWGNINTLDDHEIDPEVKRRYQNQLTQRWTQIHEKFEEL